MSAVPLQICLLRPSYLWLKKRTETRDDLSMLVYYAGFLSGFSARGGGGKSAFLGGPPLFLPLYVQVSLLFSMHITTATSISAYMDLLATRSVHHSKEAFHR